MTRVLLVEDDKILAEAVAVLLELEGFAVNVLGRGREVVGMVAREQPDALVIDVSLPDVDGVIVAQAVRNAWPKLPIIFITGHDVVDTPHNSKTLMLQKPFDIERQRTQGWRGGGRGDYWGCSKMVAAGVSRRISA